MADERMADERSMLAALLADDRLEDKERTAFEDMSSFLNLSPKSKLKRAQYEWAERRFRELELDANVTLNLHSSGKVPEGRSPGIAKVTFPWQRPDGTYDLPKKPPHRR